MPRSKEILVIDIGHSGVKLLELKGKQVTNFAYREIDPLLEGEERKIGVRQALRSILETIRFKSKLGVLVISTPRMYYRTLTYPPIPVEDLWLVMERDAQVHLPSSQGKVLLDFYLKEEKEEDRIYEVIYCDEAEVMDRVTLLEELGWRIFHAVPLPHSLVNLIPEDKKTGVRAVLDVGARSSILSIARNGKFRMMTHIPIGGNDFTRIVAGSLNVSFPQAEDLKRRENFLSPSSRLFSSFRNLISQLSDEIKLAFQSYSRDSRGEVVEELFLCGGGSKLKNFSSLLQENVGVKVSPLNLLEKIDVSSLPLERREYLRELSPQFGGIIGSASYTDLPNILRRSWEKKRREERARVGVLSYLLGIVVVSVFLITPLIVNSYRWRSEYRVNSRAIEKLLPLLEEVKKREKEKESLEKRLQFLRTYGDKTGIPWNTFFNSLSSTIPENVWVNRLEYNQDEKYVDLWGSSLSGEDIGEWISRWKEKGALGEVRIVSVEGGESSRRDFHIQVRVK